MTEIEELRRALEERWAKDDERDRHRDEALHKLANEVMKLGLEDRVLLRKLEELAVEDRRLESRIDGAGQLAQRASRDGFALEEVVEAKLAMAQQSLDTVTQSVAELRSEGSVRSSVRSTELFVGLFALAALFVVSAMVIHGDLTAVAFVPTVAGLVGIGVGLRVRSTRRISESTGLSLPPKRR